MTVRGCAGLAAAAALAIVVAHAARTDAHTPGAADAAGSAPRAGSLALERIEVRQRGWRLVIRVRTAGPIAPRLLVARPGTFGRPGQDHLCLRVYQAARLRLACFGPARGRGLRLVAARFGPQGAQWGTPWTATTDVTRLGRRGLRARVPFRALRLRPARYRIGAVAAWSGPACSPADAQGAGVDPEPVCRSQRPLRGLLRRRVRRPRLAGCGPSAARVVRAGPRSRRRVALTFDDGPSPYTGRVLDILRARKAKATFFVLGSRIASRTSTLRRMLRQGHVAANHTWRHELLAPASSLAATSRAIRAATRFTPCSFRPPGGALSSRLASDAWRLGMTTVMWDVDPQDWRTPGAGSIRSRVLSATRPGSIILLHDGGGNRSQTIAALPGIISTLRSRGYRFVTVPRLLGQRMRWWP